MNHIQALPGAFPLHEDREFITESEWVILKLLCRPLDGISDSSAEELSEASGGQIKVERAEQLIRTVKISKLPGLGGWIARLMAEAGLNCEQIKSVAADEIMNRINERSGYRICNDATIRRLADLQLQWKETKL